MGDRNESITSSSTISISVPNNSDARRQARIQTAPTSNVRDSRCCANLTKYETCIFILGIIGIAAAITKIVVIILNIKHIHRDMPHLSERETYYLCGMGIVMSLIVLIWEFPLLYFVRMRKLIGMKHWMFAAMLHVMGSSLGAVITGAVYQAAGLFLALSFLFDLIRTPAQMFLIHQFIKTEKLDEDSHYIAAYYKKF